MNFSVQQATSWANVTSSQGCQKATDVAFNLSASFLKILIALPKLAADVYIYLYLLVETFFRARAIPYYQIVIHPYIQHQLLLLLRNPKDLIHHAISIVLFIPPVKAYFEDIFRPFIQRANHLATVLFPSVFLDNPTHDSSEVYPLQTPTTINPITFPQAYHSSTSTTITCTSNSPETPMLQATHHKVPPAIPKPFPGLINPPSTSNPPSTTNVPQTPVEKVPYHTVPSTTPKTSRTQIYLPSTPNLPSITLQPLPRPNKRKLDALYPSSMYYHIGQRRRRLSALHTTAGVDVRWVPIDS